MSSPFHYFELSLKDKKHSNMKQETLSLICSHLQYAVTLQQRQGAVFQSTKVATPGHHAKYKHVVVRDYFETEKPISQSQTNLEIESILDHYHLLTKLQKDQLVEDIKSYCEYYKPILIDNSYDEMIPLNDNVDGGDYDYARDFRDRNPTIVNDTDLNDYTAELLTSKMQQYSTEFLDDMHRAFGLLVVAAAFAVYDYVVHVTIPGFFSTYQKTPSALFSFLMTLIGVPCGILTLSHIPQSIRFYKEYYLDNSSAKEVRYKKFIYSTLHVILLLVSTAPFVYICNRHYTPVQMTVAWVRDIPVTELITIAAHVYAKI